MLTRKAEFSSAHYYWNDAWTQEENERVFGKCANRNGHGHNYTLEVTVAGEVDPVSGFVVDLKELKDILEREVVSVYDHRHLNLEVPEFATRDADDGEHCDCDLGAAGWEDSEREAAPGAGVRDGGSVCGLLWGAVNGSSEGLSFAAIPLERVASAASDAYSEERNQAVYGKCNNPHGHGHNYIVEVTVRRAGGSGDGDGLRPGRAGWVCANKSDGAV